MENQILLNRENLSLMPRAGLQDLLQKKKKRKEKRSC